MLKIVKVWYNTDYLGDWILQFYPKWRSCNLAWKGLLAQITFWKVAG